MKTIIKLIKNLWLSFAKILGKANTAVLLTITYFLVIGVIAVIMRLFGLNKRWKRKSTSSTYWELKSKTDTTPDRYKYQF